MSSNTSDPADPGRRQDRSREDRVREGRAREEARPADAQAPAAARRSDPPRASGLVVETLLDAGPRGARWLVHRDSSARNASIRDASARDAPAEAVRGADPGRGPVWTARGRPPRRLVLRLAAGPASASPAAGGPAAASPQLDAELRALDAAVVGPHPAAPEDAEAQQAAAEPPAGGTGEEIPQVVAQHLIRTWGHVETSHGRGLVVEAEEAVALSRLLAARGTMTVGEVSTVLTPVAQVAAHLHRRGVAHGDITPATVLVTADGRPVLAELGDAQLLGHLPSSAGLVESLAPERRALVVAAEPSARAEALTAGQSPAADVHALGAAAWTALTGEPPAGEDRGPLTVAAPQTPGSVARLVESCLAEDPEERPSAAEVAVELYRAAAPQPVVVDERLVPQFPAAEEQPPRSRRGAEGREAAVLSGRRPRRLLAAGVAVAAAAALIVGGLVWRAASPSDTGAPGGTTTGATAGESSDAGAAEPGPDPAPEAEEDAEEAGEETREDAAEEAQEARDRAGRQLRDDDVLAALEGVAALRTSALRRAGAAEEPDGAVEAYAWPESPAAEAERRLLAAMVDRELTYAGEPMRIDALGDVEEVAARDGEQARRAVQVEVRAESFVPEDGGAGDEGEALGPQDIEPLSQQVRLTLVRREGVWKLQAVREPADADRSAVTTPGGTAGPRGAVAARRGPRPSGGGALPGGRTARGG
ncbi:protein kinase domain-containing protein [Nesterenkonia halobia]|uniref:Protein kinase domain-containing protein n=1 Tax=Nesterenkonia halobia TaxID=37922 RepID=A0ABP6RBH0_9MICC